MPLLDDIFDHQSNRWQNRVTPLFDTVETRGYYRQNGVFTGYDDVWDLYNRVATTVTLAIAGAQMTIMLGLQALASVLGLAAAVIQWDSEFAYNSFTLIFENLILAVCAAVHTIAVTAWQLAATVIKLIPTTFNLVASLGSCLASTAASVGTGCYAFFSASRASASSAQPLDENALGTAASSKTPHFGNGSEDDDQALLLVDQSSGAQVLSVSV